MRKDIVMAVRHRRLSGTVGVALQRLDTWWRTLPYGCARKRYHEQMARIHADEVRIPRHAREAVARREAVVVLNRERPVYVIVNPEDHPVESRTNRRGRPLREAVRLLAEAALPDPAFGDDMDAILATVGNELVDPWARS